MSHPHENLPLLSVPQIMDLFPKSADADSFDTSFRAIGIKPLNHLLTFLSGYAAILDKLPGRPDILAQFLVTQSENLIEEMDGYANEVMVDTIANPGLRDWHAGQGPIRLVSELARATKQRGEQLLAAQATEV